MVNLKRKDIFKAVKCYFSGDVEFFEGFTDEFSYNQVWINKEDLKNKSPKLDFADDDCIELLKNGEVDYVIVEYDY